MPKIYLLLAALFVFWFIRFAAGSTINLIYRIMYSNIIVVRRMPPVKVLRAHQLALTCALALSLLAISLSVIGSDVPYADLYPFLPLLALVLFIGSIWGWPWLLIIGLGVLWLFRNAVVVSFLNLSVEWYLWGYIFGAVLAILYNDLTYWLTLTLRRKDTRVAWAFHTDYWMNIIKSPKESEMTVRVAERDDPEGAMSVNAADPANMTVDVDPGQRLYDFKIDPIPPHPYTIAFVANPWILKYDGDPDNREDWEVDPIIRDRDLFLRMVDWALSSLERDEVVGQPEIWSRVRILAMFNEDLIDMPPNQCGMLQPYHNHPTINGVEAENLIDPRSEIKGIYDWMINSAAGAQDITAQIESYKNDIDVIFALSASPQFTRCTAHFSDWDEDTEGDAYRPPTNRKGRSPESYLDSYIFCPDPKLSSTCECHKEDSEPADIEQQDSQEELTGTPECGKDEDALHVKRCCNEPFKCEHEYFSKVPGRVALNVIGANSRTFIHEFAHAMSSAFRGAIVDEYFDRLEAHSEDVPEVDDRGPGPFMINRIERDPNAGRLVPIPKVFAEYNCIRFHSDLSHPSARENWVGYFPERIDPNATCIMDRMGYYSRFDELLSNFIYDRLITKINRS